VGKAPGTVAAAVAITGISRKDFRKNHQHIKKHRMFDAFFISTNFVGQSLSSNIQSPIINGNSWHHSR
jgi:hypothetical protein